MKTNIISAAIVLSLVGNAMAMPQDTVVTGDLKMSINSSSTLPIKPKMMFDFGCRIYEVASGTRMHDARMSSSTVPNLGMGDGNKNGKGMHVRMLQANLIAGGYLKGTTTGNFGALTRDAVKKYQKDLGIAKPNGLFGPKTKEKMKAKCDTMINVGDPKMPMDKINNMRASVTMPKMPRMMPM